MRYWKRVDANGETTTVEGYSHGLNIEGAIEITVEEYNKFISLLPVVKPTPPVNLVAEIADLKIRIAKFDNGLNKRDIAKARIRFSEWLLATMKCGLRK